MHFEDLFVQTALILAVSAFIGALGLKLRQPLIVTFIAVGVLVGPSTFNLVAISEPLLLLAEIGIAVLLFVVGLKLDLHLIRTMGPVALATGLGQVAFTSLFGFLIALGLGMSPIGALYVAVALTFSSTIIIVKLLSDKREIDALHGRIAIGFLIVQDIAVVLAMIVLTALGTGLESSHVWLDGLLVLLKGGLLIAGVALVMRFVLPTLLPHLARSQELLLLSAIAWAVLLAAIGDLLNFSKEVGAFLAGISLASTPFREAIASRLVSLRDFLLLFFFIGLGAQLDLSTLGSQVAPALLFSLFVLIGNPLIVMAIMGYMGYRKRTGFLAGLTVAQISEFSLILGALGVSLGHISQETLGLITLVGLITIGLSTYMILYSHQIYPRLAPWLDIFERRHPYRESGADNEPQLAQVDVILFGLGRYGRNIAKNLIRRGKKVLGVDFDPQAIDLFREEGMTVSYGDSEDPEILEHLPLAQAGWVISAIPGRDVNLTLLKALRQKGYGGKVVLTAHTEEDADYYRQAGADKVLWPFIDAAEQAADSLTATLEEISALAPWPVTLEEVKVRPGSAASGKMLGDLDLRERTGASVVALDRAGRSHFDLTAEFQIFPGDRLVILGSRESLPQARIYLEESAVADEPGGTFKIAELLVEKDTGWPGQTMADLDLRRRHGISVIGIKRGEQKIVSPPPDEVLKTGDILLVIGQPFAIRACREAIRGTAP
ncbi:MAG: cation:proton antiporter [Desulfuromonadales bacterium]|nr:cation:proton antiporter [Desulfuromonadales bacterium]